MVHQQASRGHPKTPSSLAQSSIGHAQGEDIDQIRRGHRQAFLCRPAGRGKDCWNWSKQGPRWASLDNSASHRNNPSHLEFHSWVIGSIVNRLVSFLSFFYSNACGKCNWASRRASRLAKKIRKERPDHEIEAGEDLLLGLQIVRQRLLTLLQDALDPSPSSLLGNLHPPSRPEKNKAPVVVSLLPSSWLSRLNRNGFTLQIICK